MAYKITDDCVDCGGCAEICENKAIIETEDSTYIDPDRCTECVGIHSASLCIPVCAFRAIVLDPEHKETRDELLAKFKKLHPHETPRS